MSIKYECCYCNKIFPSEERVDGWANGYSKGFLCPKCGENIYDPPFNMQTNNTEFKGKKWVFLSVALFVPVIVSKYEEQVVFNLANTDVSLSTILFLVWLLATISIYIFVPSMKLFHSTVIVTKSVNDV